MLITNKWVVREVHGDGYFAGGRSCEPLTSRTRRYRTRSNAQRAINQIKRLECQEFVPEYIENREVPDVPKDKSSEPPKMAVVNDASEWETVFVCAVPPRELGGAATFSKIALCRRQVGDREIFGVLAADGKLYSAGLGGGETALRRFLEEYYNYLLPRVTRESR